ncbi:MAG: Alpha-N-arabinofuranosidase, partial [Bryobacterales bacterium]|nr:Alpha-N-arabinofuranosidase [Bryobacterales bacterium]
MEKLAFVFCLACLGLHGQSQAVIEVDASRVEHAIPRTIYGSFLEPIGHSIYGGLWAQLLENPSLEENMWSAGRIVQMLAVRPALAESSSIGLPLPWQPLEASQGARYEPRRGDAPNSDRALLIMALPDKETGIRQEVYLPVHRVLRYTGSLYAKPVSGGQEVYVSLRRRDRPSEVFATQKLQLAAAGWRRYEFSLELQRSALAPREAADFVVAT